MNDNVSLKKASTFYLIGSLFNKGIGFITVPIFTRILTLSDYGIVTTYNSWVSIISMFISLALYMGIRLSFVYIQLWLLHISICMCNCLYSSCIS